MDIIFIKFGSYISNRQFRTINIYFFNLGWEGIQELEDPKPINTINV